MTIQLQLRNWILALKQMYQYAGRIVEGLLLAVVGSLSVNCKLVEVDCAICVQLHQHQISRDNVGIACGVVHD